MAVEERTLLAVIGEPYRQFMTTRKRLIPFSLLIATGQPCRLIVSPAKTAS